MKTKVTKKQKTPKSAIELPPTPSKKDITSGAVTVQFKKVRIGATTPTQSYENAACFDLYSTDTVKSPALGKVVIHTGIAVCIPEGYMGKIWTRSGNASMESSSLTVRGGVIDADYRGELLVILANTSDYPYQVGAGDKIAQLAILPVPKVTLLEVKELPPSVRGEKGLGSTGK
jgi:deoxyuridine 5'-triphosphate nucleotidohydrolase